ncbi:MAG: TonB-dependent hemoglobin/transferrin/lactoferrin family receptor [Pseudomonadota bacterium]
MKHITTTVFAIALCGSFSANAQEDLDRLEETVIGSEETVENDWQTTLTENDLVREMTDSIEDTVRYIPGVQVNDTGNRFNDDGFNIRGLEGDFVAVTVDGIDQGETLNPPSFAPYGMFGSSRGAIEVETVKTIRISRGPNSVSDGNGSLAGTVAYETKGPRDYLVDGDDLSFAAKGGYDARSDETMLSAAMANRFGDFETLFMYVMRDGNEVEAHDSGEDILGPDRGQADPVDREARTLMAKIDYYFADNQRIGLVYEDTDREADVLPLSRQSTNYFDFVADDTNDRARGGLAYEWTDAGVGLFDSLMVTADHQELITRGITRFGYSAFTPDPSDDYLRTEDRAFRQRSNTVGIDFNKSVTTGSVGHNFAYGVQYREATMTNRLYDIRYNGLTMDTGLRSRNIDDTWVPDTDSEQLTFYVRDEIALNDKWTMVAGLRHDNTEYDPQVASFFEDPTGDTVQGGDFGATVGEIGFAFEPVQGHRFGLSFGQGYKAPTAQDLYLGVGSGFITDITTGAQFTDYDEISNPNLEAEESTNYELSYTFSGERTRLTLTAFRSDYDNLIQSVSDSTPYGQDVSFLQCGRFGCNTVVVSEDSFTRAENVGKVEADGFEVDARFRLNDDWNMRFGYATVDATHKSSSPFQFDSGDQLASDSPDSAVLGVNYGAPSGKWGAEGFFVWTDEVSPTDDLSITSLNNGGGPVVFTDSWTTFDLFAYYQFDAANARLSLGIRNVFDEDYLRWEVANSVRIGNGGFFSGVAPVPGSDPVVAGPGFQRFSEPGRSVSLDLSFSW